MYDDEKKLGKSFLTNYAILSLLGSACFMLLLYFVFGIKIVILHSMNALVGIIYLETVSYIEHYGL